MELSKQDTSRQDWEDATNDLRKEFDRRLREMDKQLRRGLGQEQDEIDDDQMNIGGLRENLNAARGRVIGAIKRGDDYVSEHPLLVVGGALAVGVVIGALLATRATSRDD